MHNHYLVHISWDELPGVGGGESSQCYPSTGPCRGASTFPLLIKRDNSVSNGQVLTIYGGARTQSAPKTATGSAERSNITQIVLRKPAGTSFAGYSAAGYSAG